MAISEFEIKKAEREMNKFLAVHRPAPHVRAQFDIDYRIENQSVIIFELTPSFRDPTKKTETFVAKVTYVKSDKTWKLYCFKSDMKWHRYEPAPGANTLEGVLEIVGADELDWFFS